MEDKHIGYTIISNQFAAMNINSDNDSWQVDFGDGHTSKSGLTMTQIANLSHTYTDGLKTHNIKYYNSNKNAKIQRISTVDCQEEISAFTRCDYDCSSVDDISYAFMSCELLEDVSGLKNMKIRNFDFAFFGCEHLNDITPIEGNVLRGCSSRYSFWGTQIIKIKIISQIDIDIINSHGIDIKNHKAFKHLLKEDLNTDKILKQDTELEQLRISKVETGYDNKGRLGIKCKLNGVQTDLHLVSIKDYKTYKKTFNLYEIAENYFPVTSEEVNSYIINEPKNKNEKPIFKISNIHTFQTYREKIAIHCEINGKRTGTRILSKEDAANFNEFTNKEQLATKYFLTPKQIRKTNVLQKLTTILNKQTKTANKSTNKIISQGL